MGSLVTGVLFLFVAFILFTVAAARPGGQGPGAKILRLVGFALSAVATPSARAAPPPSSPASGS